MKTRDGLWLAWLAASGAWIWLRDTQWRGALDDSLPILAALPVFAWLWAPWRFRAEPWRVDGRWLVGACLLFPLGVALDSGLVLTLAWIALAWSWLAARVVVPDHGRAAKLTVLLALAFPWLITDFESIAWWFRLSGAQAAAALSQFCGFWVVREGTQVWANGFTVNVEPACSGMHGLQALLVAGVTLAYWHFQTTRWFWVSLPVIVGAAWAANVARIVAALWAGAWLDPVAAARWVDPLHLWAGAIAIAVAFLVCHLAFGRAVRWTHSSTADVFRRVRRWPWLEFGLAGYAAWCARGLVVNWLWAPYDRFGWLAFALWIVPVGTAGEPRTAPARFSNHLLVGAGIGFILVGALADVNALYHAAIATLLASVMTGEHRWWWLAGALSWMPTLGWLASRAGIAPEIFAFCRVAVALLACAIGLGIARPGWVPAMKTEASRGT